MKCFQESLVKEPLSVQIDGPEGDVAARKNGGAGQGQQQQQGSDYKLHGELRFLRSNSGIIG